MTTPPSSPPTSQPTSRNASSTSLPFPEAPKENRESTISRVLITPLTFLSFLISLFLIDTHNHSLRASSSPSAAPTTTYGRVKNLFHALVFTPTTSSSSSSSSKSPAGSPYAYVQNPLTAQDEGEKKVKLGVVGSTDFQTKKIQGGGSGGSGEGKGEEWHWHTKQKTMMKREVEDAFRIRKWVVVVLLFGGGCVLGLGLVVVKVLGSWLLNAKLSMGGDW